MTQTALTYRTNRDLFSNHYLTDHLRDTEPWNEVDDTEVQEAYDEIRELFEDKRDRVEDYNEAQLERNFIRPVFEILGVSYEIEETVERNARRPDYGFFETDEAADAAFDRNNFYEEAIAVADAKRWGRKLDTRGEEKRDFENPSYQIHAYLQETPTTWAVLTNGQKWRLYYGPTSHRLDSYYEIDLPTLLQHVEDSGSLEDFKDFYLFFRKDAFVEDTTGSSFLDDVYEESSVFAEALGEDLQDNIYEAIRVLAEGFLDTNDELDEDDLERIHDSSLIYLYRLIFVLYAESEGRDLLPTDNPIYRESYSLNNLKQTVAENRDETQQHYQSWQTNLWDRLEELFVLIDQGSHGKGIPKDDLYIPAYNGGLFRTDPDPDDSEEAKFLANYEAGDTYLAEVIDLLTRREAEEGEGQVFVDYSSLDERHLGSIYEGLLEYKLDVAEEPLTVKDGEYAPADDNDDIEVSQGDVYLRTDAGERKATGSYYTPEYVVEYIVDETLGPLVEDIREDLLAQDPFNKEGGGQFAEDFAERVFDLKVLDPAMGSGHFLVNAVDYLAREIIDAQERQDQQAVAAGDEEAISDPRTEEGELRDINWARRKIAQRCIYGVDLNPLATELAKVSLWLRTLAAEQPLAFLDHHLKTGNSLVGSDIENVLQNGDAATADGQLTLQQSFAHTRQQALEHVMERFQDLLSIDNETLDDIKAMEDAYEEVQEDDLYQHLLAMANVHTAETFGLDVPSDAYERMAEALRDDTWGDIESQDWFTSAQVIAEEEDFFHWELEFPVAFYDENGERIDTAGFDAVIGNPPYVEAHGQIEEYLRNTYEVPEYFVDLFHVFIEMGVRLLSQDGEFGYIVPEPWLTMENTENLREFVLSNTAVKQIVRFDNKVFDEATVDTIILTLRKTDEINQTRVLNAQNERDQLGKVEETNRLDQEGLLDTPLKRIEVRQTAHESSILEEIRSSGVRLEDISDISIGIQAYNSSKHTEDQIENRVFHSNHKKSEDYLPELAGQDVSRYFVEHDGETWVKYGDHLHDYRPMRYFTEPRILVREITDSGRHKIHAAYTNETYCNYKTILNILPTGDYDPQYLLSVLNSAAMSWVFLRTSNKVVSDTFPRISVSDLEDLIVPRIDFETSASLEIERLEEKFVDYLQTGDINNLQTSLSNIIGPDTDHPVEIHDFLRNRADDIDGWSEKRKSLNLSLLDYFGNYAEGSVLVDIGIFQPADVGILDATTEEYENLRVGDVRVDRKGGRIMVSATARYKPENEDAYETDQYGYTETDYQEAFTLTELSEAEAALIEAFVPVAVDKADGFAGFRDNATKTNSLIDRLKAITLPDPDDVAADLERFRNTKEHAEELEEKIEKTNQLVDKIVYGLYGLTEEEIEIIEEALAEDD